MHFYAGAGLRLNTPPKFKSKFKSYIPVLVWFETFQSGGCNDYKAIEAVMLLQEFFEGLTYKNY